MLISLVKLVIIGVLAFWVLSVVAPLIALPAAIWTLIKILLIVWFVYSLIKLF
jgi:hypothetical protein